MTNFTNFIYYLFIFYIFCLKSSKNIHLWHICCLYTTSQLLGEAGFLHLTEHGLVLVPLDVIEVVHDDVKYTSALGTSGILKKTENLGQFRLYFMNMANLAKIGQKSAEFENPYFYDCRSCRPVPSQKISAL